MMEKVVLPPQKPRRTEEEIAKECPWAANGHGLKNRQPNYITSLELDSAVMEQRNIALQKKYAECAEKEVRYEEIHCDDAEYIIVAFGSASRISRKAMDILRTQGVKVGLFRPITLWPFPTKRLKELSKQVKGMLVMEINAGQMVCMFARLLSILFPSNIFGRLGGIVPSPDEIVDALNKMRK